jgi:hypothetical protein
MEHPTEARADRPHAKESKRSKAPRAPEDFGALLVSKQEIKAASRRFEQTLATGHVGAAAILAETKPRTTAAKPEKRQLATGGKSIETIGRAELLNLSDSIMIDGSSLRQIYETHLIGEHGLRRLVAEHLSGGDLKKALRREVTERQIDFERDPAVRDVAVYAPTGGATTGETGRAALDKLLKQADLGADDRSEEAAFFKARATYEADQLQLHKQQRRLIDIGIGGLIILLLALVIGLYMSRA